MRILQEVLGCFFWIMLLSGLPLLLLAHWEKRLERSLKLTLALSVFLVNAVLVIWFLHQVDSHYRNAFYRWNLNCLAEQFETVGDQELLRSLEELEQQPRVMWKKRREER